MSKPKIKNYRDLVVWQRAKAFAVECDRPCGTATTMKMGRRGQCPRLPPTLFSEEPALPTDAPSPRPRGRVGRSDWGWVAPGDGGDEHVI